MRKSLSLVLAFLMVFSTLAMCIVPVAASETTGSFTAPPNGAQPIKTADDFATMDPAGIYYLANDIAISSWYNKATFTGQFYGNGNSITISTSMLFEVIDNAKIYDLTIKGSYSGNKVAALAQTSKGDTLIHRVVNEASITGQSSAGIIRKVDGNTTFYGCVNMGTMTATNADGHAGGLVSLLNSGSVVATRCTIYGDVTTSGESSCAGGLVGYAKTAFTATDCTVYGNVTASGKSSWAGGIVGYTTNASVIAENCTVYGNVTASGKSSNAGGILAKSEPSSASIEMAFNNCRVFSTISCTGNGGGIVAYLAKALNKVEMTNCEFNGSLTSSGSNAGGMVGSIASLQNLNITSCSVAGSVFSGGGDAAGIIGVFSKIVETGKTATIKIESCFVTSNIKSTAARAAGIIGNTGGDFLKSATDATFEITKCAVLSPDIKSEHTGQYAAGIAGYIRIGNGEPKKQAISSNVVISNISAPNGAQAAGIIGSAGDRYGIFEITDNLVLGTINAANNAAAGIMSSTAIEVSHDKNLKLENNAVYADITSGTSHAVAIAGNVGTARASTVIRNNVFVGSLNSDVTVLLMRVAGYPCTAEGGAHIPFSEVTELVPAGSTELLATNKENNYYLRTDEYEDGTFYVCVDPDNANSYGLISEYDSKYALASNESSETVLTDLGSAWTYVTGATLPRSTDTFTGYIPAAAKATLEAAVASLPNESESEVLDSADDFTSINPNGNYKLADGVNITLNASVLTPFYGTLDGNAAGGASITLNGAPIFKTLSGATIENLVVTGTVTDDGAAYLGAIANQATDVTVEGVTVDVTVSAANGCAGGFFGAVNGDSSFKNCTNEGDVTAYSFAGGITPFVSDTADFDHCSNSGDITATYVRGDSLKIMGFAGGITAYAGAGVGTDGVIFSVSDPSLKVTKDGERVNVSSPLKQHEFKYCSNSGSVYGVHYAGGILGSTFDSARFEFCSNGADAVITGNMGVRLYAGGIAGMIFVEGDFYRCDNAGTVIGNAMTGGIVGAVGIDTSFGPVGGQRFIGCTHTGNVTVNYDLTVSNDDKRTPGGIVGYAASDVRYKSLVISYCGVTGTIEFNSPEGNEAFNAGAFCGTVNSLTYVVVEYNYFTGSINIDGLAVATLLPRGASTFIDPESDDANYSVDADNLFYSLDKNGTSELPEDYVIYTKLPSGAIDYAWLCEFLNEELGSEVFVLDTSIDNGVDEVGLPVMKEEAPKEEAPLTEIKTAEDFLNMDPYGNYVLVRDITIDTTYPYVFFGKLNGAGYTITTTVPVFEQIENAVIQNLTIDGAINMLAPNVAALANIAVTSTIDRVTNKADVTNTILLLAKDDHTRTTSGLIGRAVGTLLLSNCRNDGKITGAMGGGLVGLVAKSTVFTARNCTNTGEITNFSSRASAAGGIVACGEDGSYSFNNCVNMGDVLLTTATEHTDYTGGMIGTIWNSSDKRMGSFTMTDCFNGGTIIANHDGGGLVGYILYATFDSTFENCQNTGRVISLHNVAGGIVGRIGKQSSSYFSKDHTATFNNCMNLGDVVSHTYGAGGIIGFAGENVTIDNSINTGKIAIDNHYTADVDQFRAGGIAGWVYAKAIIRYCVNTGDVESFDYAAGILGYSGSSDFAKSGFVVRNCVNTGNIYASRAGNASGIVGYLYGGSPNLTNNTVAGTVKSDGGKASGIIRQCNGGGTDCRNNVILLDKDDIAGDTTYLIGAKLSNDYDASTAKLGMVYGKKDAFDYLFSRSVDGVNTPVAIPEDRYFESVSELVGEGAKSIADFVLEGGIPMHKDVVAVYVLALIPDSALPELPELPEDDETTAPEDDETTEPEDDETTAPEDDGTTAPEDDGTTEPSDDGTTEPSDDGTTKPSDDGTTEPEDDGTTGSTDGGKKKKGCGSVVGGAIAIAALALITPAVVVLKKKDEE